MTQVVGCAFGFSGGGGGGGAAPITGGGTVPRIPKFTGATAIGDSQMSDNGTTVFIGATATSTKAKFEVKSTTQGALFPRLTTAQRDAITVGATEESLFIYNISIQKYQFWDNGAGIWQTIESTAIGGETLAQTLANGNTTGANNIELSSGQFLTSNPSGFVTRLKISLSSSTTFSDRNIAFVATDALWSVKDSIGGMTVNAGNVTLSHGTDDALIQFNGASGFSAIYDSSGISDTRTYTTQDDDGTLAFLSDITTAGVGGIYNGNGTAPSTTVSTLTDTINFTGGKFGIGITPTSKFHILADGSTSATSSLLIQDSGSNPMFYVQDDGKLAIGNTSPVAQLDIETPVGSAIHLGLYENRAGGAIVGDIIDFNFYYNDSNGNRQLSTANIISRVISTDPSVVNASIELGNTLQVRNVGLNSGGVLIHPNASSSGATAFLDVRQTTDSIFNTCLSLVSKGNTSSQGLIIAKNLAGSQVLNVNSAGRSWFNVSKMSGGDVLMSGTVDTNMFYADASANGVAFGRSTATAKVHITGGTATTGTAPLKFDTGTLNTTAATGAMEFASDFFYLTANLIRTAISTFGRTVVTTASYTVLITDRILGVTRTATGVSTINLPSAALYPSGYQLTIKDEALNATTFNIIIDASAAQTINGNLTATINADGDSLTIYSNGVDAWFTM